MRLEPQTNKPRINFRYGLWRCFGLQAFASGFSPTEAYSEWLKLVRPRLRVA